MSNEPLAGRVAIVTGSSRGIGSPTILVNNAGIGRRVIDVDELDLELWDETIAVGLTSAFLMIKAVVPAMRAEAAQLGPAQVVLRWIGVAGSIAGSSTWSLGARWSRRRSGHQPGW